MQQLSTGKRINTASDDAAGLSIASNFTGQIKSLNQAVRNANDGISMIQTFEGATGAITNMLQRMRELAVQAANDTYATADRSNLGKEVTSLTDQITLIANTTTWNGKNALKGGSNAKVTLQIGMTGSADALSLASGDLLGSAAAASGIAGSKLFPSGFDLSSASKSQTAIGKIDDALKSVSAARASMGAIVNRLQYAADNLTATSTHLSESRSRIEDTDYASATSELAKRQVIQQAATAMLAQANQQTQSVLTLLK
jgi:flagellin